MESVVPDRPRVDIPFHRSVRGKLTFFVVGILCLTIVCLTAIDFAYMRNTLRDEIHYELELYGESLSALILRYIEQEERLLQTYLSNNSIASILRSAREGTIDQTTLYSTLRSSLAEVRDQESNYVLVRVLDMDGIVVASTSPDETGQTLASHQSFLEGIKKTYVEFVTNDVDSHALAMNVPITDESGTAVGVAIAVADTMLVAKSLESSKSRHSSTRVRIAVAESDGSIRYLFSSDEPVSQVQESAQSDEPMERALEGSIGFVDGILDFRGVSVLTAHRPVGYNDWGLVTQVDEWEAYMPLRLTLETVVLVGIVVALISALIATTVVGRSLRPIRRLSSATKRIAEGDYSTRITVETQDEIGALGTAFNTMSETVERNTLHLEENVKERTAQLQQTTDQLSELVSTLEYQAELMDRDLKRAEIIQKSLLPRHPPHVRGITFTSLYIPGKNVGGDLYDVFRIDDRHLGLVVADATGHGVSAAMLGVLFKNRLDVIEQDDDVYQSNVTTSNMSEALGLPVQSHSAVAVFERVNEELVSDDVGSNMFVTAMFCILDTNSYKLSVASAGHPPLLVIRQSGEIESVSTSGPALGLYKDAVFEEQTIQLEQSDRVLMYTDGLFGHSGMDRYSIEDVGEKLIAMDRQENILGELLESFSTLGEVSERDDVTLLLIDIREGKNIFEHLSTLSFPSRTESDSAINGEPNIFLAEDEQMVYLTFHGRVTWVQGQLVSYTVYDSIKQKKNVVFDLTHCDYLDSAMLGTIHEITEICQVMDVYLNIQGVSSNIHDTFVELGMSDVLACVREETFTVPLEQIVLGSGNLDTPTQQKWLLRAHQALASLNTNNQEEFKDVIQELTEEIDSHFSRSVEQP